MTPGRDTAGAALGETEHEPDYRYTLANERTFLAYVRTALGLDAAGLAVKQFFEPSSAHLRLALSVGVVALAVVVAVFGYLRWRDVDRAMRAGEALPRVRLIVVLAAGMVVISAIALALIVNAE